MQNYFTTLNTMVTSNNHLSQYQIRLDETTYWQAINGFWQRSVKLQRHQRTVDERALIKIPCNDNTSEDDVMLITSHQTPFLCDLVESEIRELQNLLRQIPSHECEIMMQKFNNLEPDEQHIDEQYDELNEKQRDIKKQATDILTSIKISSISFKNTSSDLIFPYARYKTNSLMTNAYKPN